MYLSFCTRLGLTCTCTSAPVPGWVWPVLVHVLELLYQAGSDLYMYFSCCTRLGLTCTCTLASLLYQAGSDLYMYLSFCTRLGPVEYEVKALNHMLLVAAPDLPTVDRSIFCPVMFSMIVHFEDCHMFSRLSWQGYHHSLETILIFFLFAYYI